MHTIFIAGSMATARFRPRLTEWLLTIRYHMPMHEKAGRRTKCLRRLYTIMSAGRAAAMRCALQHIFVFAPPRACRPIF